MICDHIGFYLQVSEEGMDNFSIPTFLGCLKTKAFPNYAPLCLGLSLQPLRTHTERLKRQDEPPPITTLLQRPIFWHVYFRPMLSSSQFPSCDSNCSKQSALCSGKSKSAYFNIKVAKERKAYRTVFGSYFATKLKIRLLAKMREKDEKIWNNEQE